MRFAMGFLAGDVETDTAGPKGCCVLSLQIANSPLIHEVGTYSHTEQVVMQCASSIRSQPELCQLGSRAVQGRLEDSQQWLQVSGLLEPTWKAGHQLVRTEHAVIYIYMTKSPNFESQLLI